MQPGQLQIGGIEVSISQSVIETLKKLVAFYQSHPDLNGGPKPFHISPGQEEKQALIAQVHDQFLKDNPALDFRYYPGPRRQGYPDRAAPDAGIKIDNAARIKNDALTQASHTIAIEEGLDNFISPFDVNKYRDLYRQSIDHIKQ